MPFLPLLIAQALVVFVLMRRNESRPWREAVAVFDVAAVATAISLISQTYQIQGSFAEFIARLAPVKHSNCISPSDHAWRGLFTLLGQLSGYSRDGDVFSREANPMLFWVLLLLVVPYFLIRFRNDRDSRETATLAIALTIAAVSRLGSTAEFAKGGHGRNRIRRDFSPRSICVDKIFPRTDERLHVVALLGGIGRRHHRDCGLSFESIWHMSHNMNWGERSAASNVGLALEFLFSGSGRLFGGFRDFAATFRVQRDGCVTSDCRRDCVGYCQVLRLLLYRKQPSSIATALLLGSTFWRAAFGQ